MWVETLTTPPSGHWSATLSGHPWSPVTIYLCHFLQHVKTHQCLAYLCKGGGVTASK